MGWVYGLKRHVAMNHKGQSMALKITPGNTADGTVLDAMTQHLNRWAPIAYTEKHRQRGSDGAGMVVSGTIRSISRQFCVSRA